MILPGIAPPRLLPCAPVLPALLAVALLAAGAVRAQTSDAVQDLYRDALRSVAEGQRDDATESLRRVIEQEPLHAGAWLDLALVQCDLGHLAEAERLFQAIEQRFAPPPEIRALIAQARAGGCAGWQPRALYSFSAGRGISQNVNQGATSATYQPVGGDGGLELLPEFLPRHDQYTIVSADYMRDLTPNGTQGFVQFQDRRHDSLHAYDSTSLFAGIDTPWRYRRWQLRTTASLGYATLGSQLYQRQVQVQAQLTPPVPLPKALQLSLHTSLTHVDYLTLDNFRGTTGELRGQLTWRSGTRYASASAGLLDDRAAEDRPGGNRHGTLLSLQYRLLLPADSTGELGYTRQAWRSATAYAPGLIDETRRQTTHTLRATYTYPLSKNQNLLLEARRIHNQENISLFQYDDSQLQVSWQWLSP
ncbi:MAG: tetratricopeptide repeat protein [Duganella sp.]